MNYKTEQEQFWAGRFGNDYIKRNNYDLLPTSTEAIRRQFRTLSDIRSVMEIGPNIGLNLVAINSLMPDTKLAAIEINSAAVKRLKELQIVPELFECSILDYEPTKTYDVVLLVGILQHINPEQLTVVYDKIYSMSKRFIIVSDYFSPTPTSVTYRGHKNKLFKRDFVGEMLDRYGNFGLVDYGFLYSKENGFVFGDENWFVLEKNL